MVGELRVAAKPSAKLGPCPRVDLLVHRVIGRTFDDLASGEAQSLGSGSPPPAGWLPGLSGIDVIAADSALCAGLALGLPDVAEVVALGDSDDHGQTPASSPRSSGRGADHDHLDQCNGLRGCGSWWGRAAQERWQRPAGRWFKKAREGAVTRRNNESNE